MKDKKSKITFALEKEKIAKSKTLSDRYNPISEIRTKRTKDMAKDDMGLLTLSNSNNSESLKNKKKEKINQILSQFQKSDVNSKSVTFKKNYDLKSSDTLTRSRSKHYNNNVKPFSSRFISDIKSFRSNTQIKFFNNNLKETITQVDDNIKANSNILRRRDETKHSFVYPVQSAIHRIKKENNIISTRNSEIHRININLDTVNHFEEKVTKSTNTKYKEYRHKFSSSNASEDLNLSQNRNLKFYNIHKNNSTEMFDFKNLEESSICKDFKSSIKSPHNMLLSKPNCQSSTLMNSLSKNNEIIKKSTSNKVEITPSLSNDQFILRSHSINDHKRLGRPFSHIYDRRTVQELTESNTIERSIHKIVDLKKKSTLNSEDKSLNKDFIKKLNKLDEKKIDKLEKLLEKLEEFDSTHSKKNKGIKISKLNKKDGIPSINKFNINYIQTDNINFGNIQINLNTTNNISNNKLLTKRSEEDKLRSSLNFDNKRNKKEVRFSEQFPERMVSNIKSRTNNFSPNTSCNIISITILSNWGHPYKVGLTEIQLFDSNSQKINILDCHVIHGNEDTVSRFHNNRIFTIDENDMWVSNLNKNLRIELYYKANTDLDNIIIWNYNGKDLSKGVKEVEILLGKQLVWKGIINKATNRLKDEFSTHISLFTNNVYNCSRTMSDFNKREFSNIKRSEYVSIEKNMDKLVSQNEDNNMEKKSFNLEDIENDTYLNFPQTKNLRVSKSCEGSSSRKNLSKSIKLILKSNWGDCESVGLGKIKFLDDNQEVINKGSIESFSINTNKCSSLDKLFEYDNEDMWWATINATTYCHNYCEFEPIIIEIVFKSFIVLNGIVFLNYNIKGDLSKGAKLVKILIDNKKISHNSSVLLRKGIGEKNDELYQLIKFPLINYIYKEEEILPFYEFKPASFLYYQDYETPYLPSGYIFKFSLISNWGDETMIGLRKIEFFDQNGHSVLRYLTPKILYFPLETKGFSDSLSVNEGFIAPYIKQRNSESDEKQKNTIYYIFERPISISYIQIWNYSKNPKAGVREIILTCDETIIYNGYVKNSDVEDSSCCILFTSDNLITNEIQSKVYTESLLQKNFILNENQTCYTLTVTDYL